MSTDGALARQSRTARCQSCGAAVRWVHTEAGRAMPIDAPGIDLHLSFASVAYLIEWAQEQASVGAGLRAVMEASS